MEKIDNYTLVSEIGGGNFGKVYRAVNTDNQEFAIKKILTRGINQKLRELIDNEIQTLNLIDHPNILKLYNVIHRNQTVYLITELCTGGDLESYLKNHGPVPEEIGRRWIRDLMNAMRSMKLKSVVHRDLKVANILLSSSNLETAEVKICDFGFAKFLNGSITKTQLGTPLYMAPEIFNSSSYNFKIDIWSLGVLSYEMLCGSPPYKCYNLEELKRLQRKPVEFNVNISNAAKDFISTLLTFDPSQRPDYDAILAHPYMAEPKPLVVAKPIPDEISDYDLCDQDEDEDVDILERTEISEQAGRIENQEQKRKDEIKQESKIIEESKNQEIIISEIKPKSQYPDLDFQEDFRHSSRQSILIYAEKEIQQFGMMIQTRKQNIDQYSSIQNTYRDDKIMTLFLLRFKSVIILEMINEIDAARMAYSKTLELGKILDDLFVGLQIEKIDIDENLHKITSKSNIQDDEIRSNIINEGYELARDSNKANQALLIFQAAFTLFPDDEVILEYLSNCSI